MSVIISVAVASLDHGVDGYDVYTSTFLDVFKYDQRKIDIYSKFLLDSGDDDTEKHIFTFMDDLLDGLCQKFNLVISEKARGFSNRKTPKKHKDNICFIKFDPFDEDSNSFKDMSIAIDPSEVGIVYNISKSVDEIFSDGLITVHNGSSFGFLIKAFDIKTQSFIVRNSVSRNVKSDGVDYELFEDYKKEIYEQDDDDFDDYEDE